MRENIIEYDKNTREKEVLLHKAWENPKEYDVSEAKAKFIAERSKYIHAMEKIVKSLVFDIKANKQKIIDLENNKTMPQLQDKIKSKLEGEIIKQEVNLEILEKSTEQ